MADTIRFYGTSASGNCYKLQLACAELDIDYDWQEIDIVAGESRTKEFLERNANGKVPVMELPDGRYLSESNAILSYLADGSDLVGIDRYEIADVLRWMFFEQYSHEPYIATSRFIIKMLGNPENRRADLEKNQPAGYKALDVMEQQLDSRSYLIGERFSIADIALFAYTHVADEGGFDLGRYRAVREWIERIEARPKFVAIRT